MRRFATHVVVAISGETIDAFGRLASAAIIVFRFALFADEIAIMGTVTLKVLLAALKAILAVCRAGKAAA